MRVIPSPHFLPPKGQNARVLAWIALCLGPIGIGLLALALGQDANWDLRNYHYYNAFAYLNDRYDRDLLPSQTPYFYNPLIDVPFFLLATHAPARVAGFILGFVQGLNFVCLFLIAHAVLIVPNARQKVIVCIALALLGMLGGGGISQIGTTFGDNITSLGILLSVALVVRHLERLSIDATERALGLVFMFGLPTGFMVGLKLPSVIYAIGLCCGLLFIGGRFKRCFLLSFFFGLGVLVGTFITLAHWAFFLQSHFGNPLFPYFNQIFHSPLAPLSSGRDTEYVPHSMSDVFFMPFLFAKHPFRVGEIEWRDWRIPILYVLMPVAIILRLIFGRARASADSFAMRFSARYVMASFAFAYIVWLLVFTIYRYAVTLEMIAPLLIVLSVSLLPLKISTRGLIAAFLLAVVSASIEPGNWGRRDTWSDRFVEASIPELPDPSHLMILMAGIEPYSHLLPEFPPQISFTRIQSNFSSPEQDKGINGLIHERINAHLAAGGRFMMLIPSWQYPAASEALSYFKLALITDKCLQVTDRLYNDKEMSLCSVIPQF